MKEKTKEEVFVNFKLMRKGMKRTEWVNTILDITTGAALSAVKKKLISEQRYADIIEEISIRRIEIEDQIQ